VNPTESILNVEGLTKYYGGLTALEDFDLYVKKGEILSLIGPNGAGKTTTFNLITGLESPTRGKVAFKGEDIIELRPHQIVKKGIVRTFQLTRVFRKMTLRENVAVAQHIAIRPGIWSALLSPSERRREQKGVEKAEEMLRFVNLFSKRGDLAANLSLGEQKRLELAIGLSLDPELLLLDEPVAGMNPKETQEIIGLIGSIRKKGITVFLIEHDMRMVMGISERIIVLNYGKKIAEGSPEEVSRNPAVVEAYLGARDRQ